MPFWRCKMGSFCWHVGGGREDCRICSTTGPSAPGQKVPCQASALCLAQQPLWGTAGQAVALQPAPGALGPPCWNNFSLRLPTLLPKATPFIQLAVLILKEGRHRLISWVTLIELLEVVSPFMCFFPLDEKGTELALNFQEILFT